MVTGVSAQKQRLNMTQCINRIDEANRTHVMTNYVGSVRGADYQTCLQYCGDMSSRFQWSNFSQQFTGWLLPFLALTAQLPFQSDNAWHNIMIIFITVGAPQLSIYSLILTIFNSRHIRRQLDRAFAQVRFQPSSPRAYMIQELKTRIFKSFKMSHQQPFEVDDRLGVPQSIEQEINWWTCLQKTLSDNEAMFRASLAAQMAWAILAFAFTWVDAFGSENIGTNVTAFGLAIAMCWSWVAVTVFGWFFLGVSTTRRPMTEAIQEANESHPNAIPRLLPFQRTPHTPPYTALRRRIAGDAEHSGPLYNYAKTFVWSHMVENIVDAMKKHVVAMDGEPEGEKQRRQEKTQGPGMSTTTSNATPDNNKPERPSPFAGGQQSQSAVERVEGTFVRRYLWSNNGSTSNHWKHSVYKRMAKAALAAIILDFATVGSAFSLDYFTPVEGLGCRSGGVLIYWMTSYAIWFILVLAAILSDHWSAYEATERLRRNNSKAMIYRHHHGLGVAAVVLRLTGKTLAVLNTVWIITHAIFEFTGFYDRCYCLTNRGTATWIFLNDTEIRGLKHVKQRWLGLAILTGTMCTLYMFYLWTYTTGHLQSFTFFDELKRSESYLVTRNDETDENADEKQQRRKPSLAHRLRFGS
ncbi:hypothetical protein CPB86DRAFT_783180 [Serendipita vermifera]|nr:hypothetical protein CPB86DRAFT_783180 [Serendipita vermifera]